MLKYSEVKEIINDNSREELEEMINQYSEELIEAALECDISFSDIEEAYQGEYESDHDFAYETANSLYNINEYWPYTCIDWERAGRELMMDYCEDN